MKKVSHTLSISPANTGYRFGATYVGTKVVGPQEQYPIFLGDTDVAGNTTATFLHQIGDNYRVRLQGQVQQGKLVGAQGTFERRGRLSTLGLTLANTDVVNESGVVVAQLLRKLTDRLDIGAELLYQYGKQIPGQQVSMLSYSARYTTPVWTAAATLGSSGAHFTYYHKQTDNLAFGVEFESNANVGEAVGTIAYQAELPDEGVTMRASIDTNWSVGGVFEKKLSQQLPFTLALSGLFNHSKVCS
ncbi:eukaryotic porin [Oesophagostomum dentatum]|uniref:Eukaryotic porin n=1 Tax=Oesophagostomum dentatum TaxID=61180 RepID=A0A0B1STY9_OESDE|nr:eukaryotic porin [Oesophagostomum dentatum]